MWPVQAVPGGQKVQKVKKQKTRESSPKSQVLDVDPSLKMIKTNKYELLIFMLVDYKNGYVILLPVIQGPDKFGHSSYSQFSQYRKPLH